MFKDLPSFVRTLESAGELKRVKVSVDPELEITEIATRVVKEGGPALLFENVKGASYPLLINLLGSSRRMELALGAHPGEFGRSLAKLADAVQPPSWLGLWKSRKTLWRLSNLRLRHSGSAAAQQVHEAPDLTQLPILKCWPQDGGRFITFGLVLTRHPDNGSANVGLYRLQAFSSKTTGLHWQIAKGGGFHYAEAEKRDQALPVAVVIGADPALLLAAVAPLPEGMDELAFSGFLRGAPTRMTKAKTLPMDIPADAEFILEGWAQPRERQQEGPFGDHFGHYSHAAPFPVLQISTMTRRRNPIYLSAVVGKPPQEDKYLGDATQEILSPLIRIIRPEVSDLWAYYESGFHNLLVVSTRQRYGKEAMKTALGLLGEGQLSLTKCIVLVDPSVNVRDFNGVLRALRENFDSAEDALIIPGVPLDTLDFTSFKMNLGSKMILDATSKPRPQRSNARPPARDVLEGLKAADSRIIGWTLWGDTWLVVQVRSEGRAVMEGLVRHRDLEGVKIISVVSPDVNLNDRENTLWGIFTRFDCARDVLFTETRLVGSVAYPSGRLGIDATFKPGYPDPLVMPGDIVDKVSSRWNEYGLS